MSILDSIRHPAHYEVYPIQPIEIARHLNFCLGNAVKYVLRAPYKGGVEDCDKALEYMRMENAVPQPPLYHFAYMDVNRAIRHLNNFLLNTKGDALWEEVSSWQALFLDNLSHCLYEAENAAVREIFPHKHRKQIMMDNIRELRRVLELRDTTGQIYEGMSGLPQKEAEL